MQKFLFKLNESTALKVVLFLFLLCGGGPIGLAIFILLVRKAKDAHPAKPKNATREYMFLDFDDRFTFVLDNTLNFIDAYRAELPGEWVLLSISTVFEEGEFSTATHTYYDEFIEFQVIVGLWWDDLLYKNRDVQDYMESVYSYDSSERAFSYRMKIGRSTNGVMPQDVVKGRFSACLDAYERRNPNRKLARTSYGVHQRWDGAK